MSEIKVNKITPRTACGTTTLGDSGDTFTVASGATIQNLGTATGFGGTGVVSWDTGSIKTTGFTAVTGTGYFCNTTGGIFTVTLPLSPSAGDVVGVSDYANNFATNALTLGRNGSNIGGVTADSVLVVNGAAVTLVYVDATKGWIVTDSGLQSDASQLVSYVTATGGCITTCGNFKMHTFIGPGTFCVSCAGNPAGSNTVDYMVIAGGGGGGPSGNPYGGGGGGAGGFRESPGTASGSYTVSPLGVAPAVALPVSATPYAITVGGGGAVNVNGVNSTFSTITSAGGGAGGSGPGDAGSAGGSGGGPGSGNPIAGGLGNTPPTSPAQGNNGGDNPGSPTESSPSVGTGGGGAGSAAAGVVSNSRGGMGAVGVITNISNSPVKYAGGGGGGGNDPGGGGGLYPLCVSGAPSALSRTVQYGAGIGGIAAGGQGGNGTANTGGGAGGGGNNGDAGGTGGSGIIIIRYKYQ